MVMILRKRPQPPSSSPVLEPDSESEPDSDLHSTNKKVSKPVKKKRTPPSSDSSDSEFESEDEENEYSMEYEKIRDQRIRENRERMEKLGIFSLSSQIFNRGNKGNVRRKNVPVKRKRYPPLYPQSRKSERLKNLPKGQYIETEGSLRDMGITIPIEWKPEVYTEEDEKLLGDCEEKWVLKTDGFEEDGERVYNPGGTPCHQCRQKIMGKLTFCGKCRSLHGQFCGDCLCTRYGENVLEAASNPDWSCPVCRDICNCSRCRRTKGWQPINIPYSKIVSSGFRSVAHYLILTRRAGAAPEELKNEDATIDLTAEESTELQHEGSDYSAESSEYDTDDSDSEDDSKGKNKKEKSVERQFSSTEGPNESDLAADQVLLESTVQNVQPLVSCN